MKNIIEIIYEILNEKQSEFFISTHNADRAGLHHDIRFKISDNLWESFACRKEIPLDSNTKRMIYRTTLHDDENALFVGTIESGYGKGVLEEWDSGKCSIVKYTPEKEIQILFSGKKIKGNYYFIKMDDEKYGNNSYLFFKGK